MIFTIGGCLWVLGVFLIKVFGISTNRYSQQNVYDGIGYTLGLVGAITMGIGILHLAVKYT